WQPQFNHTTISKKSHQFPREKCALFAHLSNIFPKFHNIQLSEFTFRLFGENPRGYAIKPAQLDF
ncbi:hypothetical protein AALB53_25000, partial [Lachnospiraceae bacterium 47-T17]